MTAYAPAVPISRPDLEGEPYETTFDGATVRFEFWYPRQPGNATAIEVGLMDVRAADSIRITYDFERDGWSVLQASRFQWDTDDCCDPDWQEVAFIPAWARERTRHPDLDEGIASG